MPKALGLGRGTWGLGEAWGNGVGCSGAGTGAAQFQLVEGLALLKPHARPKPHASDPKPLFFSSCRIAEVCFVEHQSSVDRSLRARAWPATPKPRAKAGARPATPKPRAKAGARNDSISACELATDYALLNPQVMHYTTRFVPA